MIRISNITSGTSSNMQMTAGLPSGPAPIPVKNTFIHFDVPDDQLLVRSLTCPDGYICGFFPNENSGIDCSVPNESSKNARENWADMIPTPTNAAEEKDDRMMATSAAAFGMPDVQEENKEGFSLKAFRLTAPWRTFRGAAGGSDRKEDIMSAQEKKEDNMPIQEEKPKEKLKGKGNWKEATTTGTWCPRRASTAATCAQLASSSVESRRGGGGFCARRRGPGPGSGSGQQSLAGAIGPNAKPKAREDWWTKFLCRFPVQIEAELKHGFRVCRLIFGPGGENMKQIARETNVKLRLRGRGSGFKELPADVPMELRTAEADIPLELHLSADDRDGYVEAKRMVHALLEKIYGKYRSHCRKHGLSEERGFPQNLQVRLEEHPGNPPEE